MNSSKKTALTLASRILAIAYEMNSKAAFECEPCCAAFALARTTLDAAGLPGKAIVADVSSCDEYSATRLHSVAVRILSELSDNG